MKRITFIISLVLFVCSSTLAFAADAVEKVLRKQPGEEASKISDEAGKNKLEQSSPVVTKNKPKAWGDPHISHPDVMRDPQTDKANR